MPPARVLLINCGKRFSRTRTSWQDVGREPERGIIERSNSFASCALSDLPASVGFHFECYRRFCNKKRLSAWEASEGLARPTGPPVKIRRLRYVELVCLALIAILGLALSSVTEQAYLNLVCVV